MDRERLPFEAAIAGSHSGTSPPPARNIGAMMASNGQPSNADELRQKALHTTMGSNMHLSSLPSVMRRSTLMAAAAVTLAALAACGTTTPLPPMAPLPT
ncbi:MAG: hypothetical protein WA159_23900, partial [Variovorax sp.]